MNASTQARDRHVIVVVNHYRMRRWLVVTVATFAALISLGGCYHGPDPVQFAALAVIDGKPTAVVAVCGRPTISVHLYRDDKNDMSDELVKWSVTVTLPNQVQDTEVELLGPTRPGWRSPQTMSRSSGPDRAASESYR